VTVTPTLPDEKAGGEHDATLQSSALHTRHRLILNQ